MNDKDLIQAERNRMNMYVASLDNQLKAEKERSLLFKTKYEEAISNTEKKVEERTAELKEENAELKHNLIETRKELYSEKEKSARLEYALLEARNESRQDKDKIADLEKKIGILTQVAEAAKINEKLGADYKTVIRGLQQQLFGSKSEATCFQNGMIDPEDPNITDMGIEGITKKLMAEAKNQEEKPLSDSAKKAEKVARKVSEAATKSTVKPEKKASAFPRGKYVFDASDIKHNGLGEIPPGARIVNRSKGKNGQDVWQVEIFTYEPAKVVKHISNESSRSHAVQEKTFFKKTSIKIFMADRAPMYEKIVKDFEEYQLIRAACWVHFRRLLINAFLSDERVRPFLKMTNAIFWIEQESKKLGHNFEQRQRYRKRHTKKLVDCIFELAKEYRDAGDEYGELVHKALNYILDDEEAFRRFLDHGEVEASNNVIEYLFRHIAIGRRNWLHSGSHHAAQNIAFMYSLRESCRLNNINFGKFRLNKAMKVSLSNC